MKQIEKYNHLELSGTKVLFNVDKKSLSFPSLDDVIAREVEEILFEMKNLRIQIGGVIEHLKELREK